MKAGRAALPPLARSLLLVGLLVGAAGAATSSAQEPSRAGATVVGRVRDARTGEPVVLASVDVEGLPLSTLTDSLGRYRLSGVPPGPQIIVVRGLGYAVARLPITVPPAGTVVRDVELAARALELEGLIVTANPSGRAQGELGTASVIDREAIANQAAASLAGVLELVPGVPLSPPGLDNVQQIPLRSVPTSSSPSLTLGGPSAADVASFGTLIILDGVPLSNNANLQTTGPRGELRVPSSARGGIDLRRIPAATIERVEVIRGIPSARYGDLTQGAVIVETRAAAVEPVLGGRYDERTGELNLLGGASVGPAHALTAVLDVANTKLAPGRRSDDVLRLSAQLAHRAELWLGGAAADGAPRGTLDTRIDFFQLYENNPEDPDVLPGKASWSRDNGLRISERARFKLGRTATLRLTAAVDYTRRRSFAQSLLLRPAMPFTDRLTEGRSIGRFVAGEFLSKLWLEGDEWLVYARPELETQGGLLGFRQDSRVGLELRREWNTGPGFQFDIEFPPQVTFNGVRGFDRPRRFDEIPPVATSAAYVDSRLVRALGGSAALDVQAGVRVDLLHGGATWFSSVRDAVFQPRLNAQLAPVPWLRLRGGWGRTAKVPSIGDLYPAPQYFDVVNVNWFANNPDERLAVLTTFIRDPTNPSLGFAEGRKAEVGFELATASGDAALSLVAFSDRTEGAVGLQNDPGFLLRDRFQLTDSTAGTGRPPDIIEPPFATDTIPILVDRPANNLTLESEGFELTAHLPELRPVRTRVDVQGAWLRTRFFKEGLDFGPNFSLFQMDEKIPRAPFWEDLVRTGELAVFTYRIVHHQPALGLVVTATVQHIARERRRDVGSRDSLAFVGFITRSGELVRVPPEARGLPEFADLRQARSGTIPTETEIPSDWFMSLQVQKTLPRGGRLSFFAFNVFDRRGRFSGTGFGNRFIPALRFGLELTLPLAPWFSGS